MARGIKIDLNEYLTRLRPFLKEGCSLHESCLLGKVPYTTMVDYIEKDGEVRKRIEALQNIPILAARKSLNRRIIEDGGLALKYLERKLKKEFSTKTEHEVTGVGLSEILTGIDPELAKMVKGLLKGKLTEGEDE